MKTPAQTHSLLTLVVALLASSCGATDRTSAAPQHMLQFSLGVAHVSGEYSPTLNTATRPTLMEGAKLVQKLGGRTLKVYLTPDVANRYADRFAPASSLQELAATPQFTGLFAESFDTFVLTTYSYTLGTGDVWRDGLSTEEADAEEQEVYELATHLLRMYQDRDVNFVLQNWEGDWALLGAFDAKHRAEATAIAGMTKWLAARQRGVERARAAVTSKATVYHAVEVNLVLDGVSGRVVRDVLPQISVDAVSYSAWETLPEDRSLALPGDLVAERLEKAFAVIREAAPKAAIFIGEFGAPENEMSADATRHVLNRAVETASKLGAAGMIYWQIIDNECAGQAPVGCRGFWLTKPDGSGSLAASVLFNR